MIGGFLLNLVTGGALKSIFSEIGEWQRRKLEAENNAARIEADKQIANLEARAAVLKAEAQSRINQWTRTFMAAGPGLYIFSYFAIDKVLCVKFRLASVLWDGACRVDEITDPTMKAVMGAVVGFYFLYDIFARK